MTASLERNILMEWSLITGRGGIQNGRGVGKVLTLQKGGGAEKQC